MLCESAVSRPLLGVSCTKGASYATGRATMHSVKPKLVALGPAVFPPYPRVEQFDLPAHIG